MKKTRFRLVLALLALAVQAGAQTDEGHNRITLTYNYDLTATSYTYSTFASDPTINLDPLSTNGMNVGKPTPLKTVGSSTTVSAVTPTSAPFLYPNAGDLLICTLPFTANNLYKAGVTAERAGQRVTRVIVTNADNDTITVDTAIDLGTSTNCNWKRFITGTTATSGWFPVDGLTGINFVGEVKTINATSIDMSVECKADFPGSTGNQVYTKNFTAVGATAYSLPLQYAPYDMCRVGWKVNTDTGVQSITTYVVLTR